MSTKKILIASAFCLTSLFAASFASAGGYYGYGFGGGNNVAYANAGSQGATAYTSNQNYSSGNSWGNGSGWGNYCYNCPRPTPPIVQPRPCWYNWNNWGNW